MSSSFADPSLVKDASGYYGSAFEKIALNNGPLYIMTSGEITEKALEEKRKDFSDFEILTIVRVPPKRRNLLLRRLFGQPLRC